MKKLFISLFIVLMWTAIASAHSYNSGDSFTTRDITAGGIITAGGTNQRYTFANGGYFDGSALGQFLFYGVDTDLSFSLDTAANTINGPELYSATHSIIGIRDAVDLLSTLDVTGASTFDSTVNVSGLTTVVEQDITANFNMEISTAALIGVITKGGFRWLHDFDIEGISQGNNVFIGKNAGAPATMVAKPSPTSEDASNNIGIGGNTLSSLTYGSKNIAIGTGSLASITLGNTNIGIGSNCFSNAVTSVGNVAFGNDAGVYYGAGTDANTWSQTSLFIGNDTRAGGNFQTNQIVIGTSAIGHGTNTATLGDGTIESTWLYGDTYIEQDIDITGNAVVDGISTLTGVVTAESDLIFTGEGSGLSFAEIYTQGSTAIIDIVDAATPYQITSFSVDGVSNNMTPDHTNDHITVVTAGKYLCTISIAFRANQNQADTYEFHLAKNNNTAQFANVYTKRTTGSLQALGSASMSGIVDLAVADTIELWVIRTTTGTDEDIVVENATMSLTMLGGT